MISPEFVSIFIENKKFKESTYVVLISVSIMDENFLSTSVEFNLYKINYQII